MGSSSPLPQLKQQKSLIHGLPDDLVVEEILPKASSWWDCRSIRAVSKGWRGAIQDSTATAPKSMFAAIHRICSSSSSSSSSASAARSGSGGGLVFAVSVYDPQRGSWEQMPPIPGVTCGAPLSARCICVDGKLFVLGGRVLPRLEFLDSVFFMDLRACKRTWRRCSSMQVARAGFACMAWKGKIVVAGGQSEQDLAMASVEAYDIDRDSWSELPELEIPRADCTGAVIENGILCVIGGYSIHPSTLDCDFNELQTVSVNSMEVLELDRRHMGWDILDSGRSSIDVLRSCVISSGTLNRLQTTSAFGRSLRRCEVRQQWTIVDGKICVVGDDANRSSSDCEEDEDDPPSVLIMAIGEGSEEYVTRCELDPRSSSVITAVCKAKSRIGNRTLWQQIQVPFELVPTVSCCSITL